METWRDVGTTTKVTTTVSREWCSRAWRICLTNQLGLSVVTCNGDSFFQVTALSLLDGISLLTILFEGIRLDHSHNSGHRRLAITCVHCRLCTEVVHFHRCLLLVVPTPGGETGSKKSIKFIQLPDLGGLRVEKLIIRSGTVKE